MPQKHHIYKENEHTLSQNRLQGWLMHQQSPPNSQRNSLGLASYTATMNRNPHIILIQPLCAAQCPHRTLTIMHSLEGLDQRLAIDEDLALTLDQLHNGSRLLTLTLGACASILVHCPWHMLHCVWVSRAQEGLERALDLARHHFRLDTVQSLQNLDQTLVFLHWHWLAHVVTELGQLEPRHARCVAGSNCRERGVFRLQRLQLQDMIDEAWAAGEVGGRGGNDAGWAAGKV